MLLKGSVKRVPTELAKYTLNLVGVEVRWHMSGFEPADDFMHFSVEAQEKTVNI